MEKYIMIIGFSENTSKLLPRILCKTPRHCTPIVRTRKNYYIMFQFVRRGNTAQSALNKRQMSLLKAYGWIFIDVGDSYRVNISEHIYNAKSCVDLCKRSIGMHAPFIQTPRALYKKIKRP